MFRDNCQSMDLKALRIIPCNLHSNLHVIFDIFGMHYKIMRILAILLVLLVSIQVSVCVKFQYTVQVVAGTYMYLWYVC